MRTHGSNGKLFGCAFRGQHMCELQGVKKQGSLRYYLLSTLIAMVEILHALQSLWATLFPFALLWWNAMLYATCSKYYSWNRSRLRLQIAGPHFYGDTMQESCSLSEASNGEEREKRLFSPSCADAPHTENREMGVFSLYRLGICAEAIYVEKNDMGSISHQQYHPQHGFGVSIDPFPHHMRLLDQYDGGIPACHLNQVEEIVSCESTSFASNGRAIAPSSHTSKLSSLCSLEGRRRQPSELLKGCHWAACSLLSPHQVRPLGMLDVHAMLDVHCCPQIPLEYSCLQVNFLRKGNMLDLKVRMLIDHVSINWLREWLQTFNGGRVPALNCGKWYPDLAWKFTKFLTSRTRNDNIAISQFVVSTTEGFNIFSTISPYDAMESVKLRIGEHLSLWDVLGCKMKSSIAYVDNEDSGSASSEDLGSLCCTSITSDDGCNAMYCTVAKSTHDGFEESDGKKCYGDDGFRCYCHGYEGISSASVEDVEDVYGSFAHPAMYKGDGVYDCSPHCEVGYDGPHYTDVDGIPGVDYDAADVHHINFDDNDQDSGAVCDDFDFAYEDGVCENPLEIRQIHVALKANTWWDEGAVLVDKQESEVDSIEQEWLVV